MKFGLGEVETIPRCLQTSIFDFSALLDVESEYLRLPPTNQSWLVPQGFRTYYIFSALHLCFCLMTKEY
jgi:hypothetical protein